MEPIAADLLQEIVQRLVAEFHPNTIFLFGSHAWGEPNEDSDLDLLVIVPDSKESPAQRAVRAHRCLRSIVVPMDLLVKTQAEVDRFSGVYASLEAEILERGKVLYGRGQAGVGSQLAHQGDA
jgi:uncharacterized protein